MHYCPDFSYREQRLEEEVSVLIEVKGPHIRDRDLVRFRGCKAEWSEFEFQMWQEVEHDWKRIL